MQPQNLLKNLFWLTQVLLTYPPTVTPKTPLSDVITLMHKEDSSCVLIMQERQFLGIVSERDIIRCLAGKSNPENIPVIEALNKKAIVLKDITQLKLDRVINLLLEHHLSHIAVLQPNNQPLGVLTAESLLTLIVGLQQQISQLEAQHYDRGRIATALKDIEERYATLVSAAPVGIFRTDVEGHCLYVNERWCEITGLSRQEAMGMGWLIRLHSDDRERITRQWYRATQTHLPFRSEYRFQHKDGTLIWVLGEAVEERSKNGQLIGYIGTVTDISDRIQAEEALAKSEATNRALLHALPDMLLRHSRQGTYVDLISSGELKPFASLKELIGKHPEDVLPPQVARMSTQAIQEAIQTNELQTYEYRLQIGDNECRDYEARVVSTGNGEVLSIVRDISHRKAAEAALQQLNAQLEARVEQRTLALRESEERFRKIFEESPIGMALVGLDHRFFKVNTVLCQMLGYTESELLELTFAEITHREDQKKSFQIAAQIFDGTTSSTQIEKRYVKKNGEIVWVNLTSCIIHQPNGQPLYALSLVEDITEKKKAEWERMRLLNVIEASLNEIHIFDAQTFKFQYINQRALQNLGYTLEQMKQMTPLDIKTDLTYPQLQTLLNPLIQQKQEEVVFQTIQRRANGSYYPIEVHWQLIKQQGEYLFLSVILDISDRYTAQAERQKLVALVENSTDFIGMTTVEGKMTYLNQAGRKLIGFDEKGDITTKVIADFYFDHDCSFVQEEILSKLMEGQPWQGESRLRHFQTYAAIPVLQSLFPIKQPQTDKIIAFAGIIRDLSERKRAEVQLKTSLQQKELLLKEVHHRVKNNLQVISSIFYLQSQYIKDPQILSILEDSQNRINSMALIHEKLYHLENLAKIDFKDYIHTLVHYLFTSYNINPQLIELNFNIEDICLNLDQAISCGLLLNELISNSLKHAFPRPIQKQGIITINFTVTQEQQFCLQVEDNGSGLPENLNVKLTPSLGLRLVRALTRQLKGKLEMYNNNGAVFQVVFPQQ